MIKYRKGREILDQVAEDLSSYDDRGLLDYSKLYKVLRRCNALLGEKINPEKQEVLTVVNYKAALPDDFSNLNFAFLCTTKKVNVTPPAGFLVEYKTMCDTTKKNCSPCATECGADVVIYQKCNEQWQEFSNTQLVRVTTQSFKHCAQNCPNLMSNYGSSIQISDDGWITTDFQEGNLYLNYVGALEDDEDDLLVLDHDLVEPFYENAVLVQALKTIAYNKDADVVELYKDAKIDLSRARTQAISFVAISGYDELKNLFQAQRVRMFDKFIGPFA